MKLRARSPSHHHTAKVGKRLSKSSGGDQNENTVAEKRTKKDAPASTVTTNVAKVYNGFCKRRLKVTITLTKYVICGGTIHIHENLCFC